MRTGMRLRTKASEAEMRYRSRLNRRIRDIPSYKDPDDAVPGRLQEIHQKYTPNKMIVCAIFSKKKGSIMANTAHPKARKGPNAI